MPVRGGGQIMAQESFRTKVEAKQPRRHLLEADGFCFYTTQDVRNKQHETCLFKRNNILDKHPLCLKRSLSINIELACKSLMRSPGTCACHKTHQESHKHSTHLKTHQNTKKASRIPSKSKTYAKRPPTNPVIFDFFD